MTTLAGYQHGQHDMEVSVLNSPWGRGRRLRTTSTTTEQISYDDPDESEVIW